MPLCGQLITVTMVLNLRFKVPLCGQFTTVTLVMNLRFKVPLCGHATLAAATVLFRAAGNFVFLLFVAEIFQEEFSVMHVV